MGLAPVNSSKDAGGLHGAEALRRRLLDLVESLDYGLETFLGIVRIEVTTEVPTAAVPTDGPVVLEINPDFVAAMCPRDEDLLALVLHEIHHVLLGHTRMFPRPTLAHNIAFDAVINALICRRWPSFDRTAFFRRTNPADTVPGCLLRPPPNYPFPPRWPTSVPQSFRQLIHELYYANTVTFSDVFEAIVDALGKTMPHLLEVRTGAPSGEAPIDMPLLLGNHADDGAQLNPVVAAVVSEIAAHWPVVSQGSRGRGWGDLLQQLQVPPEPPSKLQVFRRALLAAARRGFREVGPPRAKPQFVQTAVPRLTRRNAVARALGHWPLLYDATRPGRPRRSGVEPVAIYLDVSGSVRHELPALAGAVVSLRRFIQPVVFAFSTVIVPTTLEALRAGQVDTTGGTSIACVSQHIHETRPRAAVVVTDGYVGAVPDEHVAACRRAHLQVVLTPDGTRSNLEDVALRIHQLPKEVVA